MDCKYGKTSEWILSKLILSPILGCEFFRDFKDNEYNADGLHFNWQQVKNISHML